MKSYEHIVEDEVMREIANWPEGREFKTLQPMMRMTLNVILRAVFGAEGPALDELRDLLPPMVTLGPHRPAAADSADVIWVGGVREGGFCGTGAGSTLSSTRSSPMRGPTPPSKSAATCSRC